jgi:hypothetical protein
MAISNYVITCNLKKPYLSKKSLKGIKKNARHETEIARDLIAASQMRLTEVI